MRAIMVTITVLCLVVGTAIAQENSAATIYSQQVGRFQITANANDTFLLDTATGSVWLLTQYTDFNKDPSAWTPMFRLATPTDTGALLAEFGLKPKQPAR